VLRRSRSLINLLHRGACVCEPNPKKKKKVDGAGILLQMPTAFLRRDLRAHAASDLPPVHDYGPAWCFLPRGDAGRQGARHLPLESWTTRHASGWPQRALRRQRARRQRARRSSTIKQVFILRGPDVPDYAAFERTLVLRKPSRRAVAALDIPENKFSRTPELSSNTLIYKCMLSADQIETCSPTWSIPMWNPRWRWCTSVSTKRSRRGLAHPTATCRTTADHTLRGNKPPPPQLDARARGSVSLRRDVGRGPAQVAAGTREGLSDSAHVLQRARVLVMMAARCRTPIS